MSERESKAHEASEDGVAPGASLIVVEFDSSDCANNLEEATESGYFAKFGADPNKIGT